MPVLPSTTVRCGAGGHRQGARRAAHPVEAALPAADGLVLVWSGARTRG